MSGRGKMPSGALAKQGAAGEMQRSRLQRNGRAKPGTSLERSVTLHVTDADHASRESTKLIAIDVVYPPKETGHGPGSSHEPGTGTHGPGPSTNF